MILRGALGLHLVSSLLYPCRRSWFPFLGSSHSWFLFSSYLLCLSRRSCAQFFCCQFSFLGGWGWGFWGFFALFAEQSGSFIQHCKVSSAEHSRKRTFHPPTSAQPLALSPPRGPKSLSQEKPSTAGAQEEGKTRTPPRPSEHILVSRIPEIPSLMFWASPRSCTHHMQWDNKSSSSVLVPLKFTRQTRDVISRVMSLYRAGRILLGLFKFSTNEIK